MRTLILSDGGLLSLLACAASSDAMVSRASSGRPDAVWCPVGTGPSESLQQRAASRQAGVLGLERLTHADPVWSGSPPELPTGPEATLALVSAGLLAARRGFDRVVCPWQGTAARTGDPEALDLEGIARVVDRGVLCERLVTVELGDAGPEFATPYADLSDRQIAELIIDAGAPVETCWWFASDSDEARTLQSRWLPLLKDAGRVPAVSADASPVKLVTA